MLPSSTYRSTFLWSLCLIGITGGLEACGSDSDTPFAGNGGSPATGGAFASGGSSTTTGGVVGSGGSTSISGSGGVIANGGAGGAIGSGGSPAAGGSIASGGSSTGGVPATGGAIGSGGTASGGAVGTGGTNTTGGTVGTGGTGTSGGWWKPTAGTTWQWQLTGKIDTTVNVAVYDIDGSDNSAAVVKSLHDQGRKVICYVSVGSYEDWRDDAKDFPAAVLGNDYPGWPGEKFVDIRAQALRDIMAKRFDVCKQKGFDGVEPDNMDVYENKSGFPLTQKDGVDYAKWMATEIHARGMNIGQKNASELTDDLESIFDWALTEDCYDQGWCDEVQGYIDGNKPVFMSEYTDTGVDFAAACAWGTPKKYSPILKGRDLDAPVQFCK